MTSLTLGMCGAYCRMFFFFYHSHLLLLKAAQSSAFLVWWHWRWQTHRASRKPLLCFGIPLSVGSGCMLTEARGITTQLSSAHKRAWSRGWPPGHTAPCSMIGLVCVCVCVCKWFILKQDVRVLRIHPYHQPRKLCARLQHTSVTRSKFDMCVCVCLKLCICFVYLSMCAVKAQPCASLCFSSFSSLLMTCWCSGILCGWFEAVTVLTGRLWLTNHKEVADARWTVGGIQEYHIDRQCVSTLSSFSSVDFHVNSWTWATCWYAQRGLRR